MRRPLLFVLLAMLVASVVNPGNFGTIDTHRRLQVARWIRLGEPQVRPDDLEFGYPNRSGVKQAWYGIGQSLVLVPFDWAVSSTALPLLRRIGLDSNRQEQIVELLIAFLMQWLLAACALRTTYAVLIRFEFPERAALAGAFALLLGTTYLFYIQNAQENNLLFLMSLLAIYGILRFRDEDRLRWAALAGAACGLALLTRLPSVFEAAVFFALALSLGCGPVRFAAGYMPPLALAFSVERWYQWRRFGDLFGTYAHALAEGQRQPGFPASFPFNYPFWQGLWGTLFSLDKGVFLFDPLLVLLAALLLWKWRSIQRPVRLALSWLALLLVLYIVLYARYFDFGGDAAWAHRYVATQVQLLALFAVPLLFTFSAGLPKFARYGAWTLVGVSIALQALSTTMSPNLEYMQKSSGYGRAVIVNRVENLSVLVQHRENGPRLSAFPPEWRILTYFPFQLTLRFPRISAYVIAVWWMLLLAIPFVMACLSKTSLPRRDLP